MLTPDDIGRVAVFESLEPADRERLCRVAADISLGPGEFAVHEGDEPRSSGCSRVGSRRSSSSTASSA
jgi:hypothetical protein